MQLLTKTYIFNDNLRCENLQLYNIIAMQFLLFNNSFYYLLVEEKIGRLHNTGILPSDGNDGYLTFLRLTSLKSTNS